MDFDKNTPFFSIDVSDHALTVIIDRGLLGKFPHYAGKDASHIAFFVDVKHRYHWLLFAHFVGHTFGNVVNPYAVFGFLKTHYSMKDVDDYAAKLGNAFGSTEPPTIDYPRPDRN